MKIWTAENIAYLKANYGSGNLAAIAKHRGVTVKTVRNKAYMLGLYRHSTKGRKRTPGEQEAIGRGQRSRSKYNPNPITETTRRCVCWWTAEGDSPAEIGEMLCRPAREIQGILAECMENGSYNHYQAIKGYPGRVKRKKGGITR